MLLLLAFASAMIWIGTWIGLMVRTPDAVMGVGFIVVFPLTFLSNAFVPIDSLPNVLQWVAAVEPGQRDGRGGARAVRQPGGTGHASTAGRSSTRSPRRSSTAPLLLAIAVPASLRRYRARTTD